MVPLIFTGSTARLAALGKKELQITLDLSPADPFSPHLSNLRKNLMTQHNSFKAAGGGGKKNRTVLKRFERVDLLRKRGQWSDGDRVIGLKKTTPEE